MGKEQEVLLNWTGTRNESDGIYQMLIRAVEQLRDGYDIETINEDYIIEWKSEDHHYETGKYHIEGFGTELGEPTLEIVGVHGGNYEIIPKPASPPWIRYHPPNGSGWEEKLLHLVIFPKGLEFDRGNQGILEVLREKAPILPDSNKGELSFE